MSAAGGVPPELLAIELDRARAKVASMENAAIDLLHVKSLGVDVDAVLIAKNISKLSPFVSTQLENVVVKELSEVRAEGGLEWRRQDPGFPDAGLCYRSSQTGHGIEAKAWYVNGTEITARFRASQAVLIDKTVYISLVAWIMSDIVFGVPVVLGIGLFDAADIARVRDEHYHKPPRYLVIEPEDTATRTRNLQQANVAGFKLQTTDQRQVSSMDVLIGSRWEPPYTEWSRSMARVLRQNLAYREETNFAKIDRIDHLGIEDFKKKVLGTVYRGRRVSEWTEILRQLASADETVQSGALEVIASLYL